MATPRKADLIAKTARGFWSPDEYAPVAAIRHRASHSRIFMVEGYNP